MIELPQFKLWLAKEVMAVGSDSQWVSAWTVDRSEPIGGERAVFYWLHAIQKRSREDAIRLTRLYFAVRDAGGCHPDRPFSLGDIPAGLRRDVQPHAWMFQALADANWCHACRACPQLIGPLCAWCAHAPVSELYS